jgi:para-aminobenzoate synthetase/4-amino-4-deoxychorismate lyase
MPEPSATTAYCELDYPGQAPDERLRVAFEDAELVLTAREAKEVPAVLRQVEAAAAAGRWVVGFVAYEAGPGLDPVLATRSPSDLPCASFAIFRDTAAAPRPRHEFLPGIWHDEATRQQFDVMVADIRRGIAAGDFYQVNATTRLHAPLLGDALGFFDALKASQPEALCAFLDFGRWQICSVSPEMFFDWKVVQGGSRSLTARPMKGTAARARNPVADAAAARQLHASPKERAENLMIVDLIRNDLSRVARLGTVTVPKLLSVEGWPTVWQMTSTVRCETRDEVTLGDVFGALFPCGSVTGAPKRAAMTAIAKLEGSPRGVYCGAIGVVKPGGEALFSVGIRTVVVDAARGMAECGIGSGITLDSNAPDEWAEWQAKQLFLKRACPEFELLETLRLHGGRYWLKRGHLRRLARSAAMLGFSLDAESIEAALAAIAADRPTGQWRVRLLLLPTGAARAEAFALEAMTDVAAVAVAASAVASSNPWLRHKTTRRGCYDALARNAPGIFDTLLFNEHGEVTEFTRGNLVADIDGERVTPPLACGVLPGVLREALLSRGRLRERIIRRDDLSRAGALWFINSVRGALPVRLVG